MDRQQQYLNQVFNPILIHQEEEPDIIELNENTFNMKKDISNIDNVLIDSAKKLKNLLDNTKLRLSNIKDYLKAEKERQEDMNMLNSRLLVIKN